MLKKHWFLFILFGMKCWLQNLDKKSNWPNRTLAREMKRQWEWLNSEYVQLGIDMILWPETWKIIRVINRTL